MTSVRWSATFTKHYTAKRKNFLSYISFCFNTCLDVILKTKLFSGMVAELWPIQVVFLWPSWLYDMDTSLQTWSVYSLSGHIWSSLMEGLTSPRTATIYTNPWYFYIPKPPPPRLPVYLQFMVTFVSCNVIAIGSHCPVIFYGLLV